MSIYLQFCAFCAKQGSLPVALSLFDATLPSSWFPDGQILSFHGSSSPE
jgi:hypothetical protein